VKISQIVIDWKKTGNALGLDFQSDPVLSDPISLLCVKLYLRDADSKNNAWLRWTCP